MKKKFLIILYTYLRKNIKQNDDFSVNQTSVDKLVHTDNIDIHFIIIDKTKTVDCYVIKKFLKYTL